MQVKFEQFAAASMLGSEDAPPRSNGELLFQRQWESRAFGIAIALAKKGHYEWEDFRQGLIVAIAEWEAIHCKDDPDWDYYQRWLLALERLMLAFDLVTPDELERRTAELLDGFKGVRSQESGDRRQESGARSQELGVRNQ